MTSDSSVYVPFDPAVLADPAAGYQRLLEDHPVARIDTFDPPFYILSRHGDVAAALRDIAVFSSEFGQGPRFTPPAGMLSDPPQHTFFRGLVQQAFTPRRIAELGPQVTALAEALIDALPVNEPWDLHDDFAFPLPVIVIAGMLGIPEADIHHFKSWSDASVAAMGASDPTPFLDALQALARYLQDQIAERRAATTPGDDLIAALVGAREGDRALSDGEILGVVTQLLVGGNETTTSLITNAVWRLLESPAAWSRLVATPERVDRVIEESLRFDPPVLGLFRNTTRDVTMHGVSIPAGSKVMLHYGAANRDPRVFERPEVFDPEQDRGRHLAFGLGVHFCLGAQLARLEARVALTTLARRCPRLTLLGTGERIAPFFLWGRKRLPVQA